jgi:hypothetical protein
LNENQLTTIFEESYVNEETFDDKYLYLRKSTFITFFIDNMIDVPICFKKSRSLKTKNFELPILKFSNFLMRQGKREKTAVMLFQALRLFIKTLKIEFLIIDENPCS